MQHNKGEPKKKQLRKSIQQGRYCLQNWEISLKRQLFDCHQLKVLGEALGIKGKTGTSIQILLQGLLFLKFHKDSNKHSTESASYSLIVELAIKILLGAEDTIEYLRESSHWFVDGTFKVFPSLFF